MGPIDLTVSGRYLYAQTGIAGTVDEFRINGDGSLSPIGASPACRSARKASRPASERLFARKEPRHGGAFCDSGAG